VVAALVASIAPGAGTARAGMIELTQSFGSVSSPLSVPRLQDSLSFARFDPTLGTLVSVQLVLTGNASVSAFVQSQQFQTQTFDQLVAGVGLDLIDPAGILLSSAGPQATLVSSPTDIGAFATQTYGPQSATGTDTETYTSGPELTEFIGSGQISLALTYGAFAGLTQEPFGKNLLFGPGGESVYGSASVIYTFATPTTAPQPASATLALTACGVVVGLRRFRRRPEPRTRPAGFGECKGRA
jgi:hypothetical protein